MAPLQSCFRSVSFILVLAIASAAVAQSDNSKALRYHSVLLKRPNPGYLFDRFYNTWLDTGTIEELTKFLDNRVEQDGTTADRLLLAFFHAKQGDDVKALQQFNVALANDPKNAQAWYHKAVVEARTLDFETAIANLDTASEAEPDDKLATAIAKLQGKLYVRNRQTSKALATWKKLLDDHPDDEELYEDIIELQIAEGLYEEAAALSEELVTRTQDKYEKVIRRIRTGDIQQRAGKRSKALEVYGSTLDQVGHGTWLEREILAQIEQLFRREDDLTGLKDQYQKLLEQYGKRIQIRKQYAKLLSELGESDAARNQFEEILKLTPGDRSNVEAYIAMLANSEMIDDAIKVMKALIEQNPDDGELYLQLAGLHDKAKQKKQAGEAVTKYLGASEKTEYAYLRSARLLKQFELQDEAEQTFESLTKKYPDSVAAQEARAAFLYEIEKKDEALAIWRDLAKGKERAQVVHVARVLAARNEHEAAFELLAARHDEFASDPIYLGQFVLEAIALKKFDDALPAARRRVQLARSASDLESAVAQAAQVSEKAEKTDDLIEELTNAPKRSIQHNCLLAELVERQGDSRRADEILANADDQDTLLLISQQIRLYTQRRDWTRAAEATKRLIELPEGRKTLYVRRLVELYERDYKIDEALRWVQEWKKLSPGSTMPWLTESRLFTSQGKANEAINTLRTAVQQFEDDPDVRARLAQTYVEAGKVADAERIYWRLYEDGKDLSSKLRWVQQLAQTAEFQGTTKQLIEKFEERRRTNRTSVEPLLALAEIHRVGHDYEDRRKALLEATRLKSDDLQLLYQIARIEEKEGDWERALATLQRAAKIDKTTRAREQMARLHLNYGNTDQGYAILFELAGSEKSDPRSAEAIAEAMMSVQDWQRAGEFLAPLAGKFTDDYRLHYLLGVAQEESGEVQAARETFLKILTMDKEIPGLAAQAPQAPWVGFTGPLTTLVPQESIDYLQLGWMSEIVYSHRNQRGRMPSGMFGMGSGSIQMPYNAESGRQYALAHLVRMSQLMEEEEVKDLRDAMRENGIANSQVLLEISPSMQNMERMTQLAQKFPKEKGLVALSVLMNMEGRREGNADQAAAAYEMFKDSRPQLALMAAVQAAARDETKAKLIDDALGSLSEAENPNLFLVMTISSSLGGRGFGPPSATKVPDEYRKKLTSLLLKWYPKLSNLGPQGFMVFFTVAHALIQNEDPAPFFAFLDDEIVRFRSSNSLNSAQMMQRFGGGRNEQGFITVLEFPPTTLANFPPHVGGMLQGGQVRGPFGEVTLDKWDDAEVAAALPKIKDPTLKLLAANLFEQPAVVEKTLDEMLRAKQPQLDAYLLAASKAIADEDFKVASELLDKSRYLPMTRHIRKRVDAAIVALAMDHANAAVAPAEMKPKSPIASGIKKALAALKLLSGGDKTTKPDTMESLGQQAALRLRRANLQPNEREELIAALDTLGLTDEAEKLENRIAGTASHLMTPRAYASPPNQTERIGKLLVDGKEDQAIRLVVTDLNAFAQTALANPSYLRHNRYETRQLTRLIRSHGLEERVLAKIDPGESGNALKLGQYGVACEILDRHELALKAYEKFLEKRPKDNSVRVRMFVLTAAADVEKAIDHLEKIDLRSTQLIGEAISQLIEDDATDLETRFQLVDVINKYLASLQGTDKIDLSWVSRLVEQVANSHSRGNVYLRSLYVVAAQQQELTGDALDLEQLRRTTHDALCRTMLNIPQLAPQGFTRLLALAERDGKATDEFSKLALAALLAYQPPRTSAGLHSSHTHYSSDGHRVRFRTPEEYLVRDAWKSKRVAMINDKVVPALVKANKSKVAKRMQSVLALYTCEPETFLGEATKYAANEARANLYPGHGEENPAITKVVEIWDDRKLGVSIDPLITKSLKEIVGSGGYYSTIGFVREYVTALARRDDKKSLMTVTENVAELFLGPKEKRVELIEKHYDPNSVSSGTVNAKIHGFVQIMEELMGKPEMLFVALDLLDDNGLLRNSDQVYHRIDRVVSQDVEKKADAAMQLLESSPFLGSMDQIRVYESHDHSRGTVMSTIIYRLGHQGDDLLKAMREKLAARKPKSFGAGLFAAYLADDPGQVVGVIDFLVPYETDLKKLPKQQQQRIAAVVEHLASFGGRSTLELADDSQRVYDWLKQLRSGLHVGLVKRILEAKRIDDLKMESYHLQNRLEKILPDIIRSNSEDAKKVFFKVVELVADGQKRNSQYVSGYSSGRSFAGQLLAEVIDEQHSIEQIAFAIDIVGNQEGTTVELTRRASNELNQTLRDEFNRRQQKISSNEKQRNLKALQQLYDELGEKLGDRPTTLLVNGYRMILTSLSQDELKAAAEWAKQESKSGDYPAVAHELALALEMTSALNNLAAQETGTNRDPRGRLKLQEFHDHYLPVLADENLSMTLRLAVADSLLVAHSQRAPVELVLACAKLLTETYGTKVAVTDEIGSSVISSFVVLADDGVEDTWRATASALTAAWKQRYLRAGTSRNRYETHSSYEVALMLKLCLVLENESDVAQIHRRYEQLLQYDRGVFAMFVRHGRQELASKILRGGWDHMSSRANTSLVAQFDKTMEAAIPAFLEVVPREDLKYLAEILLVTLADTKAEDRKASADQTVRTLTAAKKFTDVTFTSPAMKEKALVLLTQKSEAVDVLVKPLADVASTIDFSAVQELDDHNLQERKKALVLAYAKSSIATGNPQPVVKILDRLGEAKFQNEYYRRNAQDSISSTVHELFNKRLPKWTPEQVAAILPALRRLAVPTKDASYGHRHRAAPMNVVAHAVAGKPDELREWYEAMTDDQKKWYHDGGYPYEIWRMASQVTRSASDENVDRRIELATGLVQSVAALDMLTIVNGRVTLRGRSSNSVVSGLSSYGLLRSDDLVKHGAKIAKAAPTGGYAWAVLAEVQASRSKREEAVQSLAKAIEAAPKDDRQRQAQFRIKQAEHLQRLDRDEEAREVLKAVEGVMLDPPTTQRLDSLKKQLGETPEVETQSAAPHSKVANLSLSA